MPKAKTQKQNEQLMQAVSENRGNTPETKPIPAYLKPYIKAYPQEKVLYVTSDRQVFLEKDYSAAMCHQTTLGENTHLQTIKI